MRSGLPGQAGLSCIKKVDEGWEEELRLKRKMKSDFFKMGKKKGR